MLTAGGLPGEVSKGWKVKDLNTFDVNLVIPVWDMKLQADGELLWQLRIKVFL